jgi:hypothetical protein
LHTTDATTDVPRITILKPNPRATATITVSGATIGVMTTEPNQDTAYNDGIKVLTQYYALFGQNKFSEAYQLLSSNMTQAVSMGEFIKNSEKLRIISSRLVTAQPFEEWAQKQGVKSSPDSELMKRFYIRVYAEGEGGMAGAVPNGVHTYFATLVWEVGEWKIFSISTAP